MQCNAKITRMQTKSWSCTIFHTRGITESDAPSASIRDTYLRVSKESHGGAGGAQTRIPNTSSIATVSAAIPCRKCTGNRHAARRMGFMNASSVGNGTTWRMNKRMVYFQDPPSRDLSLRWRRTIHADLPGLGSRIAQTTPWNATMKAGISHPRNASGSVADARVGTRPYSLRTSRARMTTFSTAGAVD
jgi:hypothetical protein